jgi:hypothetical protein
VTSFSASPAAVSSTTPADPAQATGDNNPDSLPAADPNAAAATGAAPSSTTAADASVQTSSDTTPAKVRSLLENLDRRDDSNDTVVDLTSLVDSPTTTLSYLAGSLPNDPYNGTDGYTYQLLTIPDGSIMFASCGSGAIYGIAADSPDNPACIKMWASYNEILVADGAQRLLHYYSNTMNTTGVSRLRVADKESVPEGSVIVVFAAFRANNTGPSGNSTDDGYYIAVDTDLNVYYPVLCTYTDGSLSKMFVVTDPVAGLTVLQSADVEFSITGGAVGACYVIPILMGSWGASYDKADNSTSSDADTLSLDNGVIERVKLF